MYVGLSNTFQLFDVTMTLAKSSISYKYFKYVFITFITILLMALLHQRVEMYVKNQ